MFSLFMSPLGLLHCPAPLQAPIVISAAGSIHSPALLLRSKLSGRGNVGANLRLHPCTCVVGVFPPDPAQDACTTASSSGGQQQAAATSAITAPGAPAFAAVAAEPAVPAGDMEDLGAPQQYEQPRQQDQPASSADAFQQQRRLHTTGGSAVSPSGSSDASHGGSGSGSIRCWEGTLMSIFSTQAGDWEGSGYGSLLYTPSVSHPGSQPERQPDKQLGAGSCCHCLWGHMSAPYPLAACSPQFAANVLANARPPTPCLPAPLPAGAPGTVRRRSALGGRRRLQRPHAAVQQLLHRAGTDAGQRYRGPRGDRQGRAPAAALQPGWQG